MDDNQAVNKNENMKGGKENIERIKGKKAVSTGIKNCLLEVLKDRVQPSPSLN